MKLIWPLLSIMFFISCSTEPVLYPNQKFKQVGDAQAQADVDYCMQRSEKFAKDKTFRKVAGGTGVGALAGAAVGGALGVLTGTNVGNALGKGAVVGGVAGGVGSGLSNLGTSKLKQGWVNKCLSDKGYKVMGWD